MAFGIKRHELEEWKSVVESGNIAFLTHYWIHPRFPDCTTVTKVGCSDLNKLIHWGHQYGLKQEWIHNRSKFPHFDLIGIKQVEILKQEGLISHIQRFKMDSPDKINFENS
ncbi:hypothetical protein [Bacillus sp. Marseille-P3661]|uniref:hypothetical protein n=1 Tax=Bacillus sp. Marseille-P3661 TaxID=1936234 RepID=UPI000C832A06|nr:hypothetical protein [Bacillus sp. Marseille-P3661]